MTLRLSLRVLVVVFVFCILSVPTLLSALSMSSISVTPSLTSMPIIQIMSSKSSVRLGDKLKLPDITYGIHYGDSSMPMKCPLRCHPGNDVETTSDVITGYVSAVNEDEYYWLVSAWWYTDFTYSSRGGPNWSTAYINTVTYYDGYNAWSWSRTIFDDNSGCHKRESGGQNGASEITFTIENDTGDNDRYVSGYHFDFSARPYLIS